jgi:hypothetical protein
MKFRSLQPAALLLALTLTACKDSLGLKATEATETDKFVVYALTGTPPTYPVTSIAAARTVTQISGSGNFDLAFDLDPQGKVIVYPMRLVVSPITSFRDVGIQKVAGDFASITRAPAGGYVTDKTVTLGKGEVVVLQTARNTSNSVCLYGISPYIVAKIAVDSVDLKDRSIFITTMMNPNCGFRSLKTGVPTD